MEKPSTLSVILVPLGLLVTGASAYSAVMDSRNGRARIMIALFWLGMVVAGYGIKIWFNEAMRLQQKERTQLLDRAAQLKPDILEAFLVIEKRFEALEKSVGTANGETQRMVSLGIVKWGQYWEDLNSRVNALEDVRKASSSPTAPAPPSPQSGSAS